jgi:hypothetical protein
MNTDAWAHYRKLPVTIQAWRWFFRDTSKGEDEVVRYFRRPDVSGDLLCSGCDITMHLHGWIDTLEGGHIVCPGDYIIKGVKGEFYPCKPDIFAATYEEACQRECCKRRIH